ncbi:Transcription factor tau 55 kDa subunit, partial [Apiospora marii]|uniref:Transcription factor tau 55 kDa subunit n=1 Tax=Apiospora marii TaxID=335849 RepID=UPI00312D6746
FRPAFNVDPATGTYSLAIRSPTGLPTDPPLTAHGVDQANDLARHLLQVDPPIDQVYSSPYYRCLQTISPFVAKLKEGGGAAAAGDGRRPQPLRGKRQVEEGEKEGGRGTIRVEAGISEWYGLAPWEHPTSAPLAELAALFPQSPLDPTYVSRVTPARRGESIAQLHERVAAAVAAIVAQSDTEGHRAVVLNTHAAVVIALGRVLTGRMPARVDEEDFGAFTCGLSVYRRRRRSGRGETAMTEAAAADSQASHVRDVALPETAQSTWADGSGVCGGWDCEANSDCSFLRGGEERGWRFSGDEDFVSSLGSGTLEDARAGLGVVVEKGDSHSQPQSGGAAGNTGKYKL